MENFRAAQGHKVANADVIAPFVQHSNWHQHLKSFFHSKLIGAVLYFSIYLTKSNEV
jgi:hypothetical protein